MADNTKYVVVEAEISSEDIMANLRTVAAKVGPQEAFLLGAAAGEIKRLEKKVEELECLIGGALT